MPRKTQKGTLTGSKHFTKPGLSEETKTNLENVKAATEGVSVAERLKAKMDKARGIVQTVSDTAKTVGTGVKAVRQAFKGGSSLVTDESDTSLEKATEIAKGYGLELTDIKQQLSAPNNDVDDSLGEGLTASEANAKKLKIARQNNQIDVTFERLKQKRKLVKNHIEEIGLVGDVVQMRTAGVDVATKLVNYQISKTNYGIAQSKLEETEELLTQQQNRTLGVIRLTDPLKEEWDLKHQKQEALNKSIQLEVEGMHQRNNQALEEMQAWLID